MSAAAGPSGGGFREERTTSRRRRRPWIDAGAVVVLVLGWAYLPWSIGRESERRAVQMPALRIVVDEAGRPAARIEAAELGHAFLRAGLPDPPALDGADPVPVEVILRLAGEWARTRSLDALGGLGRVYQALEEHEAALACFAAAAEADPDQVLWRYGLGAECQAAGLLEPAIEALEQARRMDPEYPTTHARLGDLYLGAAQPRRAEECFREYLRLRPGESPGYVGLARVALAEGRPADAAQLLDAAVRRVPRDALARRLLAGALAAAGRIDEALLQERAAAGLPAYSGWLTFDRRLQEAHELADTQSHVLGRIRLATSAGDWAGAIRAAEQLLARRPDDTATRGNLASLYRKVGRLEEARETIMAALAAAPRSTDLLCVRAEVAFAAGDFQAAHGAIDEVMALDPDHARAWEIRGRTLYLQGRAAEALEAMRRASALDPADPGVSLALAVMLRTSGRIEEARSIVSELLERDPRNEAAREELLRLEGN
jgi:tetratricopeptide (TPR) repeat protein